MKIKSSVVILFGVLSLMAICPPAQAHNLWLNPDTHYPQVGTTVDIGIGWGHKYPANRIDQEMKEGRLAQIRAVDPDGRVVDLTKVSVAHYKLNIEKAGVYLVTAKIKSGFFTKTPEGRKWGDKKTVANPIKCTNYHIEAKTVIIAGGEKKNNSRATGQPLELIPLTDLTHLKSGDKLTVKVLFEGKPLPGIAIKATYAGFEDGRKTEHAAQKKGGHGAARQFPVETLTDDQGQAEISLDRSGYWLATLRHKPSYPDTEKCDEYMYNMAFSYQVR
jgi:uncharacterized GH25 family protein